ncbi:hypothetical protein COT20_00755, partial [bacterium (Candidatus Gribaldobacteria) CG08_land_8_20_14_0_20_39_15]
GTSIATGRYNFNIRDNDYDESQYVRFTIATDTASYITGRVTFGGQGVKDVNVFTYIPGQKTDIPGTQSTVNGWYSLGPISATGTYHIKAQASGYISEEATTSITTTPGIKTVNLALTSLPAKITGNISGSGEGYSTSSVEMHAFDANAQGKPPFQAMASSTGAYEIDVPYGTYNVQPYLEGFTSTPITKTVTVSESTTTSSGNDFTMEKLNRYISGTVVNETGQSLDWTTIYIHAFIPGSQTMHYGKTLPNCEAATTCAYTLYVPPRTYEVEPFISNYVADPPSRSVTVTSEANALRVDFSIKSCIATLSGKVVDVLGNGIQNAPVHVHKVGEEYEAVGTMTNSNGNYFLGFSATGTYQVFVEPPFGSSYLRPGPVEVDISSGSNTKNLTLNQAIKQIKVTVKLNDTAQTNAVVMAFKEGASGGPTQTWEQTNNVYTLNVDSGTWKVMAEPDSPDVNWVYIGEPYPVTFTQPSNVAETQSVTLSVTLADATVQGKILKPDGITPVIRGGVDIRQPKGIGAHSSLQNNGSFGAKVPAGTYQINVFCEDQTLTLPATATQPFTVASGAVKDFGNIVTQTKEATISGTVTSESLPVSGVRIHAHKMEAMGWADTVTDDTGDYTLYVTSGFWEVMPDPMGSGDYVSTQPPKRVLVETSTSAVSGIDFSLVQADATIKGRVVSGGSVVTSLFGFAFAYSSTASNGGPINNGTFSFKIPAGTYTVGVGFPPNSDYILDQEQQVTVTTGETKNVDISVSQTTATLEGWVKDEAGQNLPATTTVEIFAVNNKGAWRNTRTTVSEGVHTYSLGLTPGEWSIGYWIDSLDYINKPPTDAVVTISEGTNLPKNITVSKADATIQGTVYAPDGTTTLPYAFVFANSGLAKETEKLHTGTEADHNGDYTLKVKAGKYKVGAGLPPEFSSYINPDLQEVQVASGGTETVYLTFKSANSQITGTVYDIDGVTAHKAFVWAWSDKGGYSETFTMSGVYALNVNDNDTWHIGAAFDAEENYYESAEVGVNIPSGTASTEQNLTLVLKGTKPKTQTITFDATKAQVINLSDGTKIQIPAGSLASSG